MSKVICDVCGTTYPETAAQCPICGSAKKSVAQTKAGSQSRDASSYAYVRGGRFSKSNVRKRNKTGKDFDRRPAAATARKEEDKPARRPAPEKKDDSVAVNKGLVVVVVILLLAIIAVTVYICAKLINPTRPSGQRPGTTTAATTTVPDSTVLPTDGISCTGLTLSVSTIEFFEAGNSWLLNVEKEPADTTDVVTFTSSDEAVATVSETGYITAVGGGQAVITVTCGQTSAECIVVCSFGENTEQPTQPVDPDFVFVFNTKYVDKDTGKHDATIDGPGKTWRAYKTGMTVAPEDIQWSVDDESICTVENGVVTAVAVGKTELHATYGGKTYTCIIRCSWKEETEPTEPEATEPNEGGENIPAEVEFVFNTRFTDPDSGKADTTIEGIGKTWRAYKTNSGIDPASVVWTVDDESICTVENGIVTAVAAGKTELYAEYNGVVYICIVRVTA